MEATITDNTNGAGGERPPTSSPWQSGVTPDAGVRSSMDEWERRMAATPKLTYQTISRSQRGKALGKYDEITSRYFSMSKGRATADNYGKRARLVLAADALWLFITGGPVERTPEQWSVLLGLPVVSK